MEKEHGDGSALPRLVHEWLDDPGGYREENWLHHDIRQENRLRLVQFLEERLGEPVTEEALSALQALILPLHKEPHDEDRRLKPAALNRRLQALALPYEIQKTNSGTGVYILARSDGPAEKENFYVQT